MSETQHLPDADTPQARAARDRQAARDRAQRWREERRAEVDGLRARVAELEAAAAVDALLVAGLARAVARDRAAQPPGEIPVTGGAVMVRHVIDQAAKASRNAGGSYDDAKAAVGARLQTAVEAIARPVA
ncbi:MULTISPECIES: hypothetical protein [Methylobacteriaceae]|uniref:hypothetical protein n=1 Tax=Methylobacterium sp. B4 TaxID=1938755 RepID=UPI000D75367D|nr:hypothetical protein [Methylobacterium sp. B4]PXW60550.1 hypothetical protein BY998_109153 [Methylobacterium sp. B4]